MTTRISLPIHGSRKYAARFFGAAAIASLVLAGCAVEVPSSPSAPAPSSGEETVTTSPTAPANPTGSGEKVEVAIDNSVGGTVELKDGTKIEVPAGALPPGVEAITITSSPAAAPAVYSAFSPTYEFGPAGTVFLEPLKVTVPFTMPAGETSTANLTVFWSRSSGPGFDMIPTEFVSSADGVNAIGKVTHFSKCFVGRRFALDPFPPKDPYGN